jgi:orotate phosphoribosyltransferase
VTSEEALEEFRQARALLTGHFILASGLHSATYLQCARVLMDARRGERLCRALAEKVTAQGLGPFDMIVSPAVGAIVVGYEVGRQMNIPAVYLERVDGAFTLRRGFDIPLGARCLMVEDVVTTGMSSRQCIDAAQAAGANVIAGASLVDRSGGKADIGVPLVSLLTLEVPTYREDELPDHLKSIPAMKPGSRGLSQK